MALLTGTVGYGILLSGRAQMPKCSKCGENKELDQFFIRRDRPGSHKSECKTCSSKRNKAWREARALDPDKMTKHKKDRTDYFNNTLSGAMHRKYKRIMLSIKRGRGVECTLTVTDLVDLFKEQNGRCALSGRLMLFPNGKQQADAVSVDRVDCNKGYTKDNVRLVTFQANCARGAWSDDQLWEFCNSVIERRGK